MHASPNKFHLIIYILLVFLLISCKKSISNLSDTDFLIDNDNMLMGNPSQAGTGENNFLMRKPQFSLSYSKTRSIANWVSWHTQDTDLGNTERQNNFRADPELPSSWYKADDNVYNGSGFDRGHLCPSGDRTNNATNNSATFLMTNIIPQAPDNNQYPWAALEVYTRDLVMSGNEVYTIAGAYGTGGIGLEGYSTGIDQGRIAVPAMTWKALIVLPKGDGDLSRVTTSVRIICIQIPNTNISILPDWKSYRVSVDEVENATGYDLFSSLPIGLQSVIESRVDDTP
jgi:endonuclease G